MKRSLKRAITRFGFGAATLLAVAGFTMGFATAQSTTATTYQANLTPSNNSGVSGTATVQVNGNNVTVTVKTTGNSPNLAHAQHLHIGGQNTCPATPAAADTDKDGYVSSTEGEVFIGPMKVSLTTTGDASANSGLATDRFPVADASGTINYSRTFPLPSGVSTADLSKAVVETHGMSSLFGDKAKYDGDKKSDLSASLPFETTLPTACGKLTSSPVGGVNAGTGSTAGIEHPELFAIAGACVAGVLIMGDRLLGKD
jgi:hypothetical protein